MEKSQKKYKKGILHINYTLNNLILTLTTLKGNAIAISSAGQTEFKGKKKKSFFAIQKTFQFIIFQIKKYKFKNMEIRIKGKRQKYSIILNLLKDINKVTKISRIKHITLFPHNGCRIPRKRIK